MSAPKSYGVERAEREASGVVQLSGICWWCDRKFDPFLHRDGMNQKEAALFCSPACCALDAEECNEVVEAEVRRAS